ncbi:MAG: nucleotide exchange factor GrpE [Euryarchaeota archaeon]|nr:nucleotide exchange factor GrpE [Euryarchaeota archaeon]
MSGERERAPAPATEAPPETEEVARLRAALEAAGQRAEELLDQARRAQADYENLLKRTAREIEEAREVANEALLASLLPVLDDFDHAVAALPGNSVPGVRLLHEKLWKVLQDAGLEAIAPAGQPFDPFDHEVVEQANDADLADGTVKEVVQKGYRYRRRLVRPAKVIVVKRGE